MTEANKGIHVLADDNKNIIVYGFSYYWDTSDGYLALPCISTPNSDRGKILNFITPTITCGGLGTHRIRHTYTYTFADKKLKQSKW